MGVSPLLSKANYSTSRNNFQDDPDAAARWGTILYWMAAAIAALVAVLTIASALNEVSEGEPVIPLAALLLAGAIWLIGWVCRRLLSGR
jgi:hypothetical protein